MLLTVATAYLVYFQRRHARADVFCHLVEHAGINDARTTYTLNLFGRLLLPALQFFVQHIVAPEYRGQKIGTGLLEYVFQELFESGAETLFFEARDSAAAIIRSMGGVAVGEPFLFYRGNVTPMMLNKEDFKGKSHAE